MVGMPCIGRLVQRIIYYLSKVAWFTLSCTTGKDSDMTKGQ